MLTQGVADRSEHDMGYLVRSQPQRQQLVQKAGKFPVVVLGEVAADPHLDNIADIQQIFGDEIEAPFSGRKRTVAVVVFPGAVQGNPGALQSERDKLRSHGRGKEGTVGYQGEGISCPRLFCGSFQAKRDRFDEVQAQEWLAAVEIDGQILALLQEILLAILHQQVSGLGGHVVPPPLFPLVAIGAGQVAVQVHDRHEEGLFHVLFGIGHNREHLLTLGIAVGHEETETGQCCDAFRRKGAFFHMTGERTGGRWPWTGAGWKREGPGRGCPGRGIVSGIWIDA